MAHSYLQNPDISEDQIVFITDDDLWSVPLSGGYATRLTTSLGQPSNPKFSPNGSRIAYSADNSGQKDIYIIPAEGGVPQRVSFLGDGTFVDWIDEYNLLICSSYNFWLPRIEELFKLNLKTRQVSPLHLGPARYLAKNSSGISVLGRNIGDVARWKRYRGGTAGQLWTDQQKKGEFKRILKNLKSNLANPRWYQDRLLFISDHEGIGNIYQCTSQGRSLKRLTHHSEYYIRNFEVYEDLLVFQSAARIFLFDLKSGQEREVPIEVRSNFIQAQPRFSSPEMYLQAAILAPKASNLALTARGQLHVMPPWTGGPIKIGSDNKRRKMAHWHPDGNQLLSIVLEKENEETLKLVNIKTRKERALYPSQDWGKIWRIEFSPKGDWCALTNNRHEVWLIKSNGTRKIMIDNELPNGSEGVIYTDLTWSPCSRYLAYSAPYRLEQCGIKIYDLKKKESRYIATPEVADYMPTFDPNGKYLYFLGIREFVPVRDETHYEWAFPMAVRPYALCLKKDTPSPFEAPFRVEDEEEKSEKKGTNKKSGEVSNEVQIDWDDLDHRIIPFPVDLGGYYSIFAIKGKVFLQQSYIKGVNPRGHWKDQYSYFDLYTFNFKDGRKELFHSQTDDYQVTSDGKYILISTEGRLRVLPTDAKPEDDDSENNGFDYSRKMGFIDIGRIQVRVDPKTEWAQMYQEAWILQREHFWTENMANIDWPGIYTKYLPLLDKVNTRREFSDVMWEMQGELGTSHCYEAEGDYHRRPPFTPLASLGADLSFDPKSKSFIIEKIHKGDSWEFGGDSPLNFPGVSLSEGDRIVGIDGIDVKSFEELHFHLENKAGREITLHIKRQGKRNEELVTVVGLLNQKYLLYREWVARNRRLVHEKSQGRIGYIHIPDMYTWGISEFWRHYLSEFAYDGLIVDVRYNGGGNVSEFILKTLAQKTIGFDHSRYFAPKRYPHLSIPGPLVAVTNEHAGSDGDIFSHSFKLIGLGKLVGTRTWGGVVGIWPRNDLVDGSWTSQPEFSHWFKDVGWQVENYGTEPDIEVDIEPSDYRRGKDPQLEKAINVALSELKKRPVLSPRIKDIPNLRPPELPV